MSTWRKAALLEDFETPDITNETLSEQLRKSEKPRRVQSRSTSDIYSIPLEDRLKRIRDSVNKVLGRYKGFVRVISTESDLEAYLALICEVGSLTLDTETNNTTDPRDCKLMGVCCYIPNTKPVYIPVNHCVAGTERRLSPQVSESSIKRFFEVIKERKIRLTLHNARFDLEVIYNTQGVWLEPWWDTMIAAQLLDENERAGLKYQYKTHVDPTMDIYDIEGLFKATPYAWVDPETFALYSATDTYDTYRLQQYQQRIYEREGMERAYHLFMDIEMPVVEVIAHMEDCGITMDAEYTSRLDAKCRREVERCKENMDRILLPYADEIKYNQETGKLDTPINYESNQQLSLVIYEILKTPPLEDYGTSTEKDALQALHIPFTEALLEYRKYAMMLKTFTEPLPTYISPKDGKVHADFNQLGREENNVVSGRMSSNRPNVQQIPSKFTTARMMFRGADDEDKAEIEDNVFQLRDYSEIETVDGWKSGKELKEGDVIYAEDGENKVPMRIVVIMDNNGLLDIGIKHAPLS